MDYKDTLNLPKTNFSMKANLPQREPDILRVWEEKDIYGSVRKARNGKEKCILHDGPPYANGHIHMGHVLNKILKDIVVKYFTLKGYDSPYVPGWDCHGLPVEHQLLKELKQRKGEMDQVEFRKKARDYALKFVSIQKSEFKRLGVFGDWEKPYLTLNPGYEAGILRSFAKLVQEGYIYKDLKPVNWCTTCETALAEAEVEYEEHVSPSVYVKFRALKGKGIDGDNTFFVIWTTTPWTLLANVGIAVHPDLEYAVCDVGGENWILLASRAEDVLGRAGKTFTIKSTIKGMDLEGMTARHPFIERDSRVVTASYVSQEDGTGCVHTAPGHGQEDYLTGKKHGLELIMPVDARGNFDQTCGKFSGMNVHKANDEIIAHMKENGSLVMSDNIGHSYPHCWRCKRPIIFRATEQWFLKVDHKGLRKSLLEVIEKNVKWIPDVGQARIKAMIANRPDWCLSRQRYWGVPIPVFLCVKCKKSIMDASIINSLAERVAKEGVDIWFAKKAEELLPPGFKCPHCGASGMEKENDILDVWFESGVSHQSVLKQDPSLGYPAEVYLEGSDQHRGWFQSSLITGYALDGIPPYKTVLTHGFLVDGEGKKMSKSLGNTLSPENIMKKYGADILRLWVSSGNYSDDVRISDQIVERTADAYRKIRNTFRYLLSNLYDFDPAKDLIQDKQDLLEFDRWMLSRLGNLVKEVDTAYSEFLFHKIYRFIYNFCVYEISSLYLDIAKDRLYTYRADSRARRSAQSVMFHMLDSMVKMLSPILAFTSEEVWRESQALREYNGGCDSVHTAIWPDEKKYVLWLDPDLDAKWDRLIRVREEVHKAIEVIRGEGGLGSSLEAALTVYSADKGLLQVLSGDKETLASFFIVSSVDVALSKDEGLKWHDFDGGAVSVRKSLGEKCPRCWHYSGTTGQNKKYPGICQKCVDNIYSA